MQYTADLFKGENVPQQTPKNDNRQHQQWDKSPVAGNPLKTIK